MVIILTRTYTTIKNIKRIIVEFDKNMFISKNKSINGTIQNNQDILEYLRYAILIFEDPTGV